ncbi:MAG: Hsp70 family protein [Ornithinibacter sp.]
MGYQLGVDLGTTFTAAAVANGQPPTMLGLGNRALQVPSVLFLQSDGNFLVGEAAERRGMTEPSRVVREFKRRIGDHTPLLIAGTPHSAQSLTAHLLKWVVDAASERMGERPSRITVTHPANWGAYRHELLEQIISLADVGDTQTCPEPSAAAVQYAAQTRVPVGARVAIYDLGGGTFDVCVLEKTESGFTILGVPEGIEQLGGIDFDEALFRKVLHDLGDPAARLDFDEPTTMASLARLRRDCVEAKESLSADVDTVIPFSAPGISTSVRVTRSELEALIRPSLMETVSAMERALRSAGLESRDLHAIVLIGGSSRIPLVTQILRERFDAPTAVDTHPKHDIALGAVQVHADDREAPGQLTAPVDPVRSPLTAPRSQPLPEPADSARGTAPGQGEANRVAAHRTSRGFVWRFRWVALLSIVVVVAVVIGSLLVSRRSADEARTSQGPSAAAPPTPLASWSALADLPVSVEGAAVAAYQDKIWVAGGLRDDTARTKVDRVFVYDPATKTWANGPTLPAPLSHAALVTAGADLVLLGGYVDTGGSAAVLALSNQGRSWKPLAPLPASRVAGAAVWDGRRILYAGGTRSDQTAGNEVWSYENGRWRQIGQLQHGRAKLAAVSNGQGQAWFMGGYDKESRTHYPDVDVVNEGQVNRPSPPALANGIDSAAAMNVPTGGKCVLGGQTLGGYNGWTCDNAAYAIQLPTLDPPRAGMGAAVIGRTIYVVGGYNEQFNGTNRVEALTLPDRSSQPAPGGRVLSIPTTSFWTPTDIVLRPGDVLTLTATGEIADDVTRPNQKFNPDGAQRNPANDVHHADPYPAIRHAALIGRFGASGPAFFVGRALRIDTVADPTQVGQLYLGIDDSAVNDNNGTFTCTATITKGS